MSLYEDVVVVFGIVVIWDDVFEVEWIVYYWLVYLWL